MSSFYHPFWVLPWHRAARPHGPVTGAQVPLERPALRRRGRGLWPVAPAQCDASRGSVTIVMVVIHGD